MSALLLMLIIFYIYSCIGLELITKNDWSEFPDAQGEIDFNFRSLFRFMLTLTQFAVFDSSAEIYLPIIYAQPTLTIYFMSYYLVVGISLMNLLMAIIVEGSMEQSRSDKEVAHPLKNEMLKKYLPRLYDLFMELDADGSGSLELEEIQEAPEHLREELSKLVDDEDVEEVFNIIDTDGSGSIEIDEFFEGITKLVIGSVDVNQLRTQKQLTMTQNRAKEIADQNAKEFKELNEKIDSLIRKSSRK